MQTAGKNKVAFHTSKGISFFQPDQIIRLEAKSNYTRIFFCGHKPMLLAKVLKELEILLLPFGFVRTHRSHLVNKNSVSKINSEGNIVMTDESVAGISRRRRMQVIEKLMGQ